MEKNKKIILQKFFLRLAFLVLAIIILLPFYFLILDGVKSIVSNKPEKNIFIFENANIKSLKNINNSGKIFIYLGNTFFYVLTTSFFVILISLMAGYGYEIINKKDKKWIKYFFIFMLIIPIQTVLIPLYLSIGFLKINTYIAILFVYLGMFLPLIVLLSKRYFRSFPNEIIDSLIIDGLSHFNIFVRVIVPMSSSFILSMSSLIGYGVWSEFFVGNIFANKDLEMSLMVGVVKIMNTYRNDVLRVIIYLSGIVFLSLVLGWFLTLKISKTKINLK